MSAAEQITGGQSGRRSAACMRRDHMAARRVYVIGPRRARKLSERTARTVVDPAQGWSYN